MIEKDKNEVLQITINKDVRQVVPGRKRGNIEITNNKKQNSNKFQFPNY